MSVRVHRVDAFTRDAEGGNPAGVVLEAGRLSPETMQEIAAKLGYSETAFLISETDETFTIRFFAPSKEVAICGHATVALFHTLSRLRGLSGTCTMRCGVGELSVNIETSGRVFLSQKAPVVEAPMERAPIAAALGIDEDDLVAELDAHRVASTGLRKIFAEVRERETLNVLDPNEDAIRRLSEAHEAIGIYVYTAAPNADVADWYCRNYAPVVGIWDDAATGTSAAALSGVLAKRDLPEGKKNRWVFFQGDPIGVPSRIDTHWQSEELWVGGEGTIVETFDLELDDK